jgi:hypothetical protein
MSSKRSASKNLAVRNDIYKPAERSAAIWAELIADLISAVAKSRIGSRLSGELLHTVIVEHGGDAVSATCPLFAGVAMAG